MVTRPGNPGCPGILLCPGKCPGILLCPGKCPGIEENGLNVLEIRQFAFLCPG